MRKLIQDIVTVLVVIAVVFQVYDSYRRDKRVAAQIQVIEDRVSANGQAIKANGQRITEFKQAEDAYKVQAIKDNDAIVAAIRKIKLEIPPVAHAMPLPEAIDTTRRVINDPGVDAHEGGVLFTETAFRFNLAILMQSEQWGFALTKATDKANALSLALSACDAAGAKYEENLKLKDAQLADKDKEIKLYKDEKKKDTLRKTAIGIAIGVVLGLLIHK